MPGGQGGEVEYLCLSGDDGIQTSTLRLDVYSLVHHRQDSSSIWEQGIYTANTST